MKVLIVNGSPRKDSNTTTAVKEIEGIFAAEGVEYETLNIGKMDIRGCIACDTCETTGKCVFDDIVNEASEKLRAADGFIIASPVYYASANGTVVTFMDRLFYSNENYDLSMKVAASVVCARRGGCSSTFDELNKYFTINGMPVVSSQYWNSIYGLRKGDAEKDAEGRQTMRVLARNMIFLMKAIADAKEKYGLPEKEEHLWTHFI